MKIIYTYTDEAPALATHSLLPIVEAFARAAGVEVETRDISLAGRILAQFPERLSEEHRVADALAELGRLAGTPAANIIKLPNVSASGPQLRAAIKELQEQGLDLPDYPDEPADDAAREVRERYDRVKGSAVNPVLREGNSDRRAPASVKAFAQAHPHSMGAWSPGRGRPTSRRWTTGTSGTPRSRRPSGAEGAVRIEHVAADGTVTVLKERTPVLAGEVLDAAVMRRAALEAFLREQVADAQERGLLFSVHLKATMMKVSDPIIFGHAVRAVVGDVFDDVPDVSPNDGLGGLLSAHPDKQAAVEAALAGGPAVAMVDSDRGITNFHVPSDVIIDASMPAAFRSSGQMWNAAGELQDTKFVIPDHSYASLYAETIDHCREHGAFDPATMGTTPNVGLMAQKAEEYGSHDKTFEIEAAGTVRAVAADGATLFEHDVEPGDIWRMCQTKDAPIRDWVRLAVDRARATGAPAVFWLDEARPHDAQVLAKVRETLGSLDTDGLQIEVMPVAEATRFTLERARRGEDTISVTGNVLRDYLTDLFPILELGTSAKMLSIVPLMAGGGLFETGAGGSAPKHVPAVPAREPPAVGLARGVPRARGVARVPGRQDRQPARAPARQTLDRATGTLLEAGRSPSRKVGELDNRGSHVYLALYWAQELARQSEDEELAARFAPLARGAGRRRGGDRRGAARGAGLSGRPRGLLPA
jgi:isocitrate dehydrogenase